VVESVMSSGGGGWIAPVRLDLRLAEQIGVLDYQRVVSVVILMILPDLPVISVVPTRLRFGRIESGQRSKAKRSAGVPYLFNDFVAKYRRTVTASSGGSAKTS
jgi:hypothetical protein